MLGKVLIPDGEAASDPSWTVMGFGAFASRQDIGNARQYVNKLRMTNTVPIGPTTLSTRALVGVNEQRALLILQNNSDATVAGDTAPTMYFGFGTQPVVGQDLALPPGVGLVLDVRCPADAIYVAFGPFVNAGGSTVIQGMVKEGGVTDPLQDTANMSDTGQLATIIALIRQALGLR
jgi:hypothetical protein